MILVQVSHDAEFDDMPPIAVATALSVDLIGTVEELEYAIRRLVERPCLETRQAATTIFLAAKIGSTT